ncbi:complement C3-like [Rhinoraja longicauda]
MRLLVLLIIRSLSAAAEQNPPYLITVPSEVHVGQNETITLQVFEAPSNVTITVYFEKQTEEVTEVIVSQKYTAELGEKNNFTQVILAQILPEKTLHLDFLNEEQYVTIVTEISSPFLVTKRALIRLKSRPYFIYIATDKPVYAPTDTVHYQIFTLDQELKPIQCTITVELLDSEGRVLSAVTGQNVAKSVHIGKIPPSLGSKLRYETYQIRASVVNNSEYYGLKRFQVRKYEHPKFGLRIIPEYWYFVVNSDTFSLMIQVACKTDGALNATVSFGISLLSGPKVPLPELDQHVQVVSGGASVILREAGLLRSIQKAGGMDTFIGSTLYIAAEVSDGEHTQKKFVDNIAFRLSHYNISFPSMKPYFTPGALFYIPISVTYPNGAPAVNVSLQVNITIVEEGVIKESIAGTTDQLGEAILSLTVPVNALILNITTQASVGSASSETEKKHAMVKRHGSDSGRYLHIHVPRVLLYPEDTITVNLTALGLSPADHVQHFYYMVLGKGRTLDFQRVERRSETSFELLITAAMVPYFRIVAYYPLNDGGRWSIVADSVRVEAESLCDTKFQVHSVSHEPDLRQLQLTVLSDTPAQIFVKITDVRLKPSEGDDSITPRRVFEDLISTDIGLSSGSGRDPASVFKDSGLFFLSNLMTPFPQPVVFKLKKTQETWRRNDVGQAMDKQAFGPIRLKDTGPSGDEDELTKPLFQGTSMWSFDTPPGNKTFRFAFGANPPESWDLHALSLSEEDGLCLAGHTFVQPDAILSPTSCTAPPWRRPHRERTLERASPPTVNLWA